MSFQPTFWEQLNAEQRRSCRRNENPVNIDGRQGWEVCGILREKWNYMFPSIQAHLNSRAAKIFKTHQGRQIEYAFWPYMIGTPTDFRPYVVASCLYLDIAKRVLKVIHERLRCVTPRPGFGYQAINCRITLPMERTIPVEPVLAQRSRNMCGLAINIKCGKDTHETVSTATIGGCLCIGSEYYGFTVAHALAAGFQSHSNPMLRSAGPTSESWEDDAELSDLSESDDELDASTAKFESLRLKPGLNEFSWKPHSDLGPWQTVSKASFILGDNLDWLIFPLGNEIDRFENVVKFDQNRLVPEVVCPKEVEGGLPADIDSITLVTGVSGKKQVRPSSALCGIYIPSAGRVIQVWSIRSGSYVAQPGDSGSWAIGEGGEVYGYLVGICERLGAGYVAPMSTAMAAIRAKTGTSKLTIPGRSAGTGGEDRLLETQSTRQHRPPAQTTEPRRREPERMGAWQPGGNRGPYRILVINGSPYIQYENDMKNVQPYNPSSNVPNKAEPRFNWASKTPLRLVETAPETRKEPSVQRHNVNYAPISGTQRSALANPRASQHDIVATPPFTLFSKDDDITDTVAASPPDHANYAEARSASTSRRQGSRDRGGTYPAKTRHDEDVEIEPGVTKRTGSTAPPQGVVRPSTNTPSSTTTGTARQPPSKLSRYGQEFAKIAEGDYQTCQEFMARNPEIFDENPNDFLAEAARSQVEGQVSQARKHVQQVLLLRKLSKKSSEETRVFLSRLNGRDARERDAFRADFNTIYDTIKAHAAAALSNPTSGPALTGPDSKSAHRVPAEVRHAPEPTLRDSGDGVSESLEKLHVSTHNPRNPTRADGPPSNATRPPTVKYPLGGGQRQTLTSVDAPPSPTQSDHSLSQGSTLSIASMDFRGDGEAYEQLDERYYVRLDGGKFFKVGRVFAMLWHEGAGDLKGGHLEQAEEFRSYRAGKYGEKVYSHILRMAVVKESHGYCWCIPIHTYDGRGVLKPGFNRQDQEAHAIIYMDDTRPESTSKKEKDAMTKIPIAVHPASPEQKLHPMSRLNFGSPYTVQMNVKVMNVGKVIPGSMPAFESYWRNEMNS